MATLLYAAIGNQTSDIPLVEGTLASGNFSLVVPQLLRKVQPGTSMSYAYEDK